MSSKILRIGSHEVIFARSCPPNVALIGKGGGYRRPHSLQLGENRGILAFFPMRATV